MRRGALALVLMLLLAAPGAADENPARIAWFPTIQAAREAATKTGRPIFIAMHPKRVSVDAVWPYSGSGWAAVYADEELVALTRRFACVRHRVGEAPAPVSRDLDARPQAANRFVAPAFLVFDAAGTTLLARADGWTHAEGADSVAALKRLLEGAWGRLATKPTGPELGPADVSAPAEPRAGSLDQPLGLAPDAPGVRVQLAWSMPVPTAGEAKTIPADVSMYWDGAGPFALGRVELPVGADASLPVEVRFADHPELEPLRTKGRHRLDFYISPVKDAFQFSEGPLFIGVVWLVFGDGGGGGGAAGNKPEPKEAPESSDPNAPEPQPDEPKEAPPIEPPPPGDEHVVEPFIREGAEVEKDDAIVGVESDDAGVKPPPLDPTRPMPRDFEKVLESSVHWDRIPLAERAFLRRYFAAMQEALKRIEDERKGRKGK